MRMRDRIAKAVRMRLELNAPHISGWAQALSLQVRCRVVAFPIARQLSRACERRRTLQML
jgi:hypothetical protein